jgi:hypothetical protein
MIYNNLVWNVSMMAVEPGEIVEINAITGELALS